MLVHIRCTLNIVRTRCIDKEVNSDKFSPYNIKLLLCINLNAFYFFEIMRKSVDVILFSFRLKSF